MFIMSVIALAAIGLPVGLAVSLMTHDLNRLVEYTAIGTVVVFAVVVLAWRWAMHHSIEQQEARTGWLHTATSDVIPTATAWPVLRGEVRPEAAVADKPPDVEMEAAEAGSNAVATLSAEPPAAPPRR